MQEPERFKIDVNPICWLLVPLLPIAAWQDPDILGLLFIAYAVCLFFVLVASAIRAPKRHQAPDSPPADQTQERHVAQLPARAPDAPS